jgi:hypothetical protein
MRAIRKSRALSDPLEMYLQRRRHAREAQQLLVPALPVDVEEQRPRALVTSVACSRPPARSHTTVVSRRLVMLDPGRGREVLRVLAAGKRHVAQHAQRRRWHAWKSYPGRSRAPLRSDASAQHQARGPLTWQLARR